MEESRNLVNVFLEHLGLLNNCKRDFRIHSSTSLFESVLMNFWKSHSLFNRHNSKSYEPMQTNSASHPPKQSTQYSHGREHPHTKIQLYSHSSKRPPY